MKHLKFLLTLVILSLIVLKVDAQVRRNTIIKDFRVLIGSWQGSLTYLDYSSGKPYTMPADIDIKRIGKTNQFSFANIYPNEKSANSIDTVTISSNGYYINYELLKSRTKLLNGDIEIITEQTGKDGNDDKPAIFRHTYTFGKIIYKNRKDVQFVGETKWINRHEYSYERMPMK